jgi:TRAP-type C4-dicarboxylate transport system permease small subunit
MFRLIHFVERVLDKVLIVLFLFMVAAIVWQVFARYVLHAPTIWSEELARFLLVWITMLGSAYVLEHGEHVAVTVLVDMLPEPFARSLSVVRDFCVIAMAGSLTYFGYGFAVSGLRRVSTGLGLTMTWAYTAVPVGAALIAFFLLARRLTR